MRSTSPRAGRSCSPLGACILAVLVRSQLAALFGALAFGLLALGWRSATMRRWRESWSRWDWVGAVVLGIGAVIAVVAFLGHRSNEWEVATTAWKGRMVEYGSWAGGAFAIGIGVLPAIALLAVLAVPARRAGAARAFARSSIVSGGAVVSFGWYAAIKGAYLSTTFSSLVVERNLVYLSPLAFVATAYLLERAARTCLGRRRRRGGRARPGRLDADRPRPRQLPVLRGARPGDPRAREPRVAVAARPDRDGRRRPDGCLAWFVLLLLGTSLRARLTSVAGPVAVAAAVALVGWNLTAEVYASIGEHDFSARVEGNIPKPQRLGRPCGGRRHGRDARAADE